MSYFTYKKRKTTLKSVLAILGLTIGAFALMANPAYADPDKKVEDATEMIDETVEQVEDAVKDKMAAPADTTDPMELPQMDGTADAPIQTAPETVPEITMEEPVGEAPAVQEPAEFSTPILSATVPALDKAQSCYKQESGALECICEGDKDCAELTSSDICEPGTSWRNDEGFGGCTKKTD